MNEHLADICSAKIQQAFCDHQKQFHTLTDRAAIRFAHRDWKGIQSDALARLDLYRQSVDGTETGLRHLLGDQATDQGLWARVKAIYSDRISDRPDREIADTFFNSITRRIFATQGVDPQIEFVHDDTQRPWLTADPRQVNTFQTGSDLNRQIQAILASYQLRAGFADSVRDAEHAANRINKNLKLAGIDGPILSIQMIRSIFYRGKAAYLIGRIQYQGGDRPLVLALHHPRKGIVIDAVLMDEISLSILFSFTRAHFLVRTERPGALAHFLRSILPKKRMAEIYTSIGYHKHGKTELFRSIRHHTRQCQDVTFQLSPGKRGLVMIVIDMPTDDIVYKLIRDRFASPKTVTRREVIQKYELVFRHDRAGRLLEAQTFEGLCFDRCWFTDELIRTLLNEAGQNVTIQNSNVIIKHAYIERRVTPLDLFLENAKSGAAKEVLLDFGHAIKDLALSNIFPGDMLIKNFGVTRHGRVVFYDYDELCLLTDCRFRKLPQSRSDADELSSEPWYYVDDNDIFPEEFPQFLGIPPDLKKFFWKHHADLFDTAFWINAQQNIEKGLITHILPYGQATRLP